MTDPENFDEFKKNRIKLRVPTRYVQYYGTIVKLNYPKNEYSEHLQKLHISNKKMVVVTLNMLTERT